jgi:hypothetical protein
LQDSWIFLFILSWWLRHCDVPAENPTNERACKQAHKKLAILFEETSENDECTSVLPDGIFSYLKFQLGFNFEGLGMENVGIFLQFGTFYGHLEYLRPFGIFCCHLVYFVDIWYILWPVGTFCGHLVYVPTYFFRFWYVVPRKIWQPWCTYVGSRS